MSTVLDGEIACVDDAGRPTVRDLLFRQRQCIFIAFDLLYLDGKDLRMLPLIKRKAMLKKLLRRRRSRILYLDHVEGDGVLLFEQIVAMDLEGMVCKRKGSPYKVTEKPSPYWIKVKNPAYSQAEGREELFELGLRGWLQHQWRSRRCRRRRFHPFQARHSNSHRSHAD